jgi:hypothetical protein
MAAGGSAIHFAEVVDFAVYDFDARRGDRAGFAAACVGQVQICRERVEAIPSAVPAISATVASKTVFIDAISR